MRCLRSAILVACIVSINSCAVELSPNGSSRDLRDNLAVAEAALAAGQPVVARRLYLSLAERFEDMPEPALGLGHIALDAKDFVAAERYFLQAAERAGDVRATRAEALLGVGRAALATGRTDAAAQYFQDARDAARGLPSDAWAANGMAVSATIDADYETAEVRFGEALRLSSGHPRIRANHLRMLIEAGRAEEAAGEFAQHHASYWLDGDGDTLSRLIEDSRHAASAHHAASVLMMRLSPSGSGAIRVQRFDPPASSGLLFRLGEEQVAPSPPAAKETVAQPALPAGIGQPQLPIEPGRSAVGTLDRTTPAGLTLTPGQGQRLSLPSIATSVLVASPEVADVQLLSPEVIYIIGKTVGRTSVAVLGEKGKVRDWIVSVALDLEPIHEILANEPELHGIRAKPVARGIVLTGEVASAALAERALRLATGALPEETPVENELQVTGAQQVNLEVQIAEVQRSVSEDLGINWEAFRIRGDDLLGFRIGRFLPGPSGGTVPTGLRATIDGEVSPGLFYSRSTANTRIAGMIDALARAGLANVLARPNVTAVSGEAASFFSGGEFPLPTGFDDGVIVFEYKKYGILLDFVPTVIDTGRIVLKVRPEVSEPSLNQAVQVVGVDIPVINVRRAETTVEVGDGESIVIAGLFRNASNTREAGVPGLKDVPVLGMLFGHRSIRSEELELIVIVTARLVTAGTAAPDTEAPRSPRVDGYHF